MGKAEVNSSILDSSFDDTQLKNAKDVIGSQMPKVEAYDLYKAIGRVLISREERSKPGVVIVTECGETHHVQPSQKVSKIYIDGKQIHF